MERPNTETRCLRSSSLRGAGDTAHPTIEATFIVFDEVYDMGWCSESIDRHALDETIHGDIRALVDHDTTLVLGRTTTGTLTLRIDDRGVHGTIEININDADAMNLYARVQRGDVSQCSFCFSVIDEDHTLRNGKDHFTVTKLELYEVSIVTFPAYETTTASARSGKRKNDIFAEWKKTQERKVKKWQHSDKS